MSPDADVHRTSGQRPARLRVLMLSWEYPPVLVGGLGRHVHALSDGARGRRRPRGHRRHPARAGRAAGGVRRRRPRSCGRRGPATFPLATADAAGLDDGVQPHPHPRRACGPPRPAHYDVIHAHDWLVAHTAVTLAEHLDLPLVTTIHATEAGRHQGWLPEEMNSASTPSSTGSTRGLPGDRLLRVHARAGHPAVRPADRARSTWCPTGSTPGLAGPAPRGRRRPGPLRRGRPAGRVRRPAGLREGRAAPGGRRCRSCATGTPGCGWSSPATVRTGRSSQEETRSSACTGRSASPASSADGAARGARRHRRDRGAEPLRAVRHGRPGGGGRRSAARGGRAPAGWPRSSSPASPG